MNNRLPFSHWAGISLLFLGLLFWPAFSYAQQGAFNFSYNGPTVFGVDSLCSGTLEDAIQPLPNVTSNVGATIIVSQLDEVQTGWGYTDPIPAGVIVNVFWYVEDNMGNSFTFNTFSIEFVDDTPPLFDLNGVASVIFANSIVQVPPVPNLAVYENCGGNVDTTFVQTTPPDTCGGGVFTRTWTATDEQGNSSVFTQTITVYADTLPPFINVLPVDGAAPCEELATAYPAWLAAQEADIRATDPSGIKSITNNAPPVFPPGCAQTISVTFRAQDNCGLNSNYTVVFETADSIPPIVDEPARDTVGYCSPTNNHLNELGKWISNNGYIDAVDSCTTPDFMQYEMRLNGVLRDSAQLISDFLNSFDGTCQQQTIGGTLYDNVVGSVTVEFTVKDACGNDTPGGTATFAAIDTFPPIVNGPPLITEECGFGSDSLALQVWINARGGANLTDECTNPTWVGFAWNSSTGDSGSGLFGSGPYPSIPTNDCDWFVDVAFIAEDGCGNQASDILRFQLIDTTAPGYTGAALPDTLYCPAVVPTLVPADWSDNCDAAVDLNQSSVVSDSVCGGQYTLTVTWIATDDCGNTSELVKAFAVVDTAGPNITLVPEDVTLLCDAVILPDPPTLGTELQANDDCGSLNGYTFNDVSAQDPDPAVCGHYNYSISRTFTVSDDCGNTSTAVQQIFVIDTVPPVFTGFTDTTAVCEVQPVMPPPTASDACSGPTPDPVLQSEVIIGGPCDDTYTIRLTWEAVDVCGNTGTFVQDILVQDTVRPSLMNIPANVTVACDAIPVVPSDITGDDNCDETVDINFAESFIRNPDTTSCDHWSNYIIRREWTAVDNCGNTRRYTQNISVTDNAGPVMEVRDTIMVPADPGECGISMLIPPPLTLYDICSSEGEFLELRDTIPITNSSGQPANLVPIDTIKFTWPAPVIPPIEPVTADAVLSLILVNADSEAAPERLEVWGENGYFIGYTETTPNQCGSSQTDLTIPADLMNDWLTDGDLMITLAPIGTGPNSINAICPGGEVQATISFPVANPFLDIDLQFSLDGAPFEDLDQAGPFDLDVGLHEVDYVATDCAGNSSTGVTVIIVEDLEPPVINTPMPLTGYADADSCSSTVTLPFPGLSENCAFSDDLVRSSSAVTLTFEFDPNAQFVPADVMLNVPGVVPNAVTGGTLRILHRGDNETAGEFFEVFDENNTSLGITSQGSMADQCTEFHETSIFVSAAQINNWAANGSAQFTLRSNRDVVNFSDFIGPCGPLNGANQDGISAVQAILEYNFAAVTYEITNAQGNPVADGLLNGGQTTVDLPPGNFTVQYRVLDANGNAGMTSFPLSVLDTVAPTAICDNAIIFTNPSGAANYTLTPGEINNGSFDNCTNIGLSFSLSQTTFTCNQAGMVVPVTLTVTDTSGNAASCQATVRIETIVLDPDYTENKCMGDTVQLFANPPTGAVYTYQWSGPNGYSSSQQNPLLVNTTPLNEGTYVVTITGPTGCTASGNITVDLIDLPQKPTFIVQDDSLCFGEDIVFTTNVVSGTNVSYNWYQGIPPNGTLLASTTQPTFQINQPQVSAVPYRYYLVVNANGCSSVPSNFRFVWVFSAPESSTLMDSLTICSGQVLSLGTNAQGPGISYRWNGPGGWMSTAQNPIVTTQADTFHSGTYTLLIYRNGCESAPATTVVNVKPRPAAPLISGAGAVCLGDSIKLVTDVNGAGFVWNWISPGFDTTTINGLNQLLIDPVNTQDSGTWRVYVIQQGCASQVSGGHLLKVLLKPTIQASANTPFCAGDLLQLNATTDVDNLVFSWSGPNNYNSSSQNPVTFGTTGTYTVIGRTQGASCADTASVDVVEITPPIITSITNNAPVCATGATSITLQPTVFPPDSTYSTYVYNWTGPAGFSSALQMPVIPNASSANNGSYNLIVTDTFGCESAAMTEEITIEDIPTQPIIAAVAPICVGDSVVLQVSNSSQYSGNVTYTWSRPSPLGPITTTEPELPINPAASINAGMYTVKVRIGSCESISSLSVNLMVNPIPAAPVVSVQPSSTVCSGGTLSMFTPQVSGASYMWMGPGGWTSTLPNPVISPVDTSDAGFYNVQIEVNGCLSPQGQGITVEVNNRPKTPVILPPQAVCLDTEGSTVTLRLSPSSVTSGAQYVWLDQSSGDTLSGPSFGTQIEITDLSTFSYGLNGIYAFATQNGCSSIPSAAVQVQMDSIPDEQAFAGMDRKLCEGAQLILDADEPEESTGRWTQVAGLPTFILNPNDPKTPVNGLDAPNSYQYRWTLSNGACVNFSSDTVTIESVPFEVAQATVNFIDTCYAESVVIEATPGVNSIGQWSQPSVQNQLMVGITDPDEPFTSVFNLGTGVYFFYWSLTNEGCPVSTDTVVVRVVGSVAFAGNDQSVCSTDSCAGLQASALPANETGVWSSPSPNLKFASPTSPNTTVCGLVPGPNMCIWTTNEGLCGEQSRDTMIIDFEVTPTAVNDTVNVPFGVKITFDVLFNDILPDQYDVEVVQLPAFGLFEQLADGVMTYQPDISFTGQDVLVYKLCNINCVDACDFANVVLKVNEPTDCVIPTLITPNNDGVNDVFFVPCLNSDVELDNEVTIFNRWGDEVFHASPYGNDWDGKYNGSDLPAGTYYYVVKFNGDGGTESGFLIIQR